MIAFITSILLTLTYPYIMATCISNTIVVPALDQLMMLSSKEAIANIMNVTTMDNEHAAERFK